MEIHAQDDIAKWYLVDSCTFHTTFTVKCPLNTRSVLAKTGECQSGYVLYYVGYCMFCDIENKMSGRWL